MVSLCVNVQLSDVKSSEKLLFQSSLYFVVDHYTIMLLKSLSEISCVRYLHAS